MPGYPRPVTDNDDHDALNLGQGTTPRASGFRFYWWAGEGDETEMDNETDIDGEAEMDLARVSAESFPDRTLQEAADELAASVGVLIQGTARWRSLPAGGAGENGIVELIASVGGAFALLHYLLKTPGAAKEAWEHVSRFLDRAKRSRVDWEASSDLAIGRCLARVQEEWPGAYTNPFAVKVVEDGSFAAMFVDRPTGVHVIVLPDLCHKKTHVFAIDSRLVIHGHIMIDRLTSDAESAGP